MVEHYKPLVSGRHTVERFRQMTQILAEEGHLVNLTEDRHGVLTMHKRSCPFISMFEEMRTVCDVDLDVMSAVVGVRVERTTSRHDGAPCCTFALASAKG